MSLPSHGENMGSSPLGSANKNKHLAEAMWGGKRVDQRSTEDRHPLTFGAKTAQAFSRDSSDLRLKQFC